MTFGLPILKSKHKDSLTFKLADKGKEIKPFSAPKTWIRKKLSRNINWLN